MIRVSASSPWSEGLYPEAARAPWSTTPPEHLAFAALRPGHESDREDLVRVIATRRMEGERWESLDLSCRTSTMLGSAGAGLGSADEDGQRVRAFLRGRTVIVASREPFTTWWSDDPASAPRVLGLDEIATLCLPGRLTSGEIEPARLAPEAAKAELSEPGRVRAMLASLAVRVLGQPAPALALLVHTLRGAARALEREESPRARDLELVLALLEHPSTWIDRTESGGGEDALLRDNLLSVAVRELPTLADALDAAQPRWKRPSESRSTAHLPALRLAEERTLGEQDLRLVDEIFRELLPRHFAAQAEDGAAYRLAQHGVASVIAAGFGRRELRLVHAPTGTGKTLAYLVPVALWAARNHARVGVATYTKALQEQALERETPLALELLREAAGVEGIRVTVLKGRENYLCWRALCAQARRDSDPADEQLAWAALALFALRDPAGDLDRFAIRVPLAELDPESHRRVAERLLRAVRCETGCCTLASDRATCAAESAWRAAERAHVVITNHALALARRDFFQHLVFDECEHLHDVAQNAFSSSVSLREIEGTLSRLADESGRRPLGRVVAYAPKGSEAALQAERCLADARDARAALSALGEQCRVFQAWRAEHARERNEADQHSLFREFVRESGEGLVADHDALCGAMDSLERGLALLQETLEGALPSEEGPRLRRTLELLRTELAEERAALVAWIPRDAHRRAAFGRESFHDLETTSGGDQLLVTRVLLPHEHLGRHYYPELAGAVLLSATTWLRGGFESSAAYLGLTRASAPAPDEEREPVPVESFRAPESFDYSRVLVAVPRDAPAVADKLAWLDYTASFLARLGERTRGRLLALFTNAEDVAAVGQRLEPFFAARGIPFWWQRMRGVTKEELGQLFREEIDSVLLGLDTFWYGADFPGSTLEYLVLARLPYGVPDRYHHAQCAALGAAEQRRTIYLPRALAKFRQGFGRLMRKESDRGCVFVLDKRVLDPRHRGFLQELPLKNAWEAETAADVERLARLTLGETGRCIDEALAHMGLAPPAASS